MHEQVIAKQIIKEAEKHGKVSGITVEVGDLGHVPIKDMERALKILRPWAITIIAKQALIKCTCGYKGAPKMIDKGHDYSVFECTKCANRMPKILDGADIILKEVILDK